MDKAAPALRRLEAVETGAKTVYGITHARGKEGASRPNGGSTHGPWRISRSPALSYALPNAFFDALGLPRLAST